MDTSPSALKILPLQQLPAFIIPETESSRVLCVSLYLQKLVEKELLNAIDSLELPSIAQLSNYLKCAPMEVYDALRALREKEYDYQFSKFNSPIRVWLKADRARRRNV